MESVRPARGMGWKAYTLAMLLDDHAGRHPGFDFAITATDVTGRRDTEVGSYTVKAALPAVVSITEALPDARREEGEALHQSLDVGVAAALGQHPGHGGIGLAELLAELSEVGQLALVVLAEQRRTPFGGVSPPPQGNRARGASGP
mgnify:CR=1 FL=1